MKKLFLYILLASSFGLFSQNEQWRSKYSGVLDIYNGHHIVVKSGLYGMVDSLGSEVIPPVFANMLAGQPSDGLVGVTLDNQKWGFVNTKGKIVFPFDFDGIFPFSDGRAIVRKGERCALLASDGNVVVPFIFDYIYPFKNGIAKVLNWTYFDKKRSNNGELMVYGGNYGCIDISGKVIVPLQFDDISDFQDGIAVIQKGGLYGLIDIKGNILLRPVCTEIKEFASEKAIANVYDRWVYVDKSGKICDEVEGMNAPKKVIIPVDKVKLTSVLAENMVLVDVSGASSNKCCVFPKNNYYISKFEVTFGLFKMFMDDTGYITSAERKNEGNSVEKIIGKGIDMNMPVCHVTWGDCNEFCFWLTRLTGKLYRLPNEAEWEFAARGGKKSMNFKYAGSNELNEVCWSLSNASGAIRQVGMKKANELGLYDMNGNVGEWCANFYLKDMVKSLDENAIAAERCVRGGSCYSKNSDLTVSNREAKKPRIPENNIGFRMVADVN